MERACKLGAVRSLFFVLNKFPTAGFQSSIGLAKTERGNPIASDEGSYNNIASSITMGNFLPSVIRSWRGKSWLLNVLCIYWPITIRISSKPELTKKVEPIVEKPRWRDDALRTNENQKREERAESWAARGSKIRGGLRMKRRNALMNYEMAEETRNKQGRLWEAQDKKSATWSIINGFGNKSPAIFQQRQFLKEGWGVVHWLLRGPCR